MGLSGGTKTLSSTQTQNSTVAPSAFSSPYITEAANALQSDFQNNQGKFDQIGGNFQSLIPKAFSNYTDNTNLGGARSYVDDILGGKYLQGNPFLQQIIDQTSGDVTNRVQSSLGSRGLTGGSAHSQILGRELAKNESGLRYQDYANQQGRMDSAVGMASGLNSAENSNLAAAIQAATTGIALPMAGSDAYAQAIAGLLGQYTNQTGTSTGTQQVQKPSLLGQILSGASSAAQAYAAAGSDRRLKVNVAKVGQFDDGLGIYEYDYIEPPEGLAPYMAEGRQRGVMADEVEALRPWALGPVINGFATVNYGAL